jgi:TonB-linked SusC/RagA family outer membrane protein
MKSTKGMAWSKTQDGNRDNFEFTNQYQMKNNKLEQLNDSDSNYSYMYSSNVSRFQNLLKSTNFKGIKILFFMLLMMSYQAVLGQSQETKIIILNDNGKPFKSVIVESVENKNESGITDKDGVAILNLSLNTFIRLSFSDMQKLVEVKSQTINVKLGLSDKKINLGFGLSKSTEEITSAIDVVYFDKLEKSSLNNPSESLYGQLSGLMVLQNIGEPWSRNATISVRGRGTLGNNAPLVMVDGFERELSSLALLDIESVSVLKDGTALARFGQRGANGVVLITTKKGEYDSFKIEVSYDQGWNFPLREPEFLNSFDYANAVNQASILDGNAPVYSNQDLSGFQSGENPSLFPNVNWFDETFRDFGTTTNMNVSFTGGGKSVKYFASLNYQNERGLFDNTTLDDRYESQLKYDRLNFRTNLDIDLTNTTKFIVNVSGNIDGRTEPGARVSGVMDALYSIPSAAFPVRTPNGEWGGTAFYDNNPVALVSSTGIRQPNGRQIAANGQIIQDLNGLMKGLSAEIALGYDNEVNYFENRLRGFLYESLSFTRDPLTGEINDTTSTVFGNETDLGFSNSFGNQLRHTTLYGKLNYDTSWENSELNTSLMFHQDKRVREGQYNTFLRQNIMATASYAYKNKYFIDGVLSYAGSSVLPNGDKFGLFPAISAAWVLNREKFLKDSKTINYLKLRASWGMSGNDIMAPNLDEQAFANGGGYLFTDNNGSLGGIGENRLATQGLTYENSIKTNVGIDMELLGSLSLKVDAFYDQRKNILVNTNGAIPSLIGVATPIENSGEVINRGVETALRWKEDIGGFKYFIGGNFMFAKNEIIEMNEEFQPFDYLRETGNSIGQQFGLQSLGFFKDQEDINNSPQQLFSVVRPGDIKYKDQNNDGVIDNFDVVAIGYADSTPEMYYSFDFGFEMGGVGVNLLFQGIANKTVFLNTKSVFIPLRGNSTISDFSENSWTPETANTATLPRLSLLENENNYRKNDIWLARADYLKLRRFEVYYNFPENVASKLKMKNAKIYGRGMNVFSIDSIKETDPEATGVGYPSLASYHLGIKFEF